MSNPFSRTMRSLNADSFSISRIGMAGAVLLLAAWSLWFFMAEVPIYKISKNARIIGKDRITTDFPQDARRVKKTLEKLVIAEFLAEDTERIQKGQPAILYLTRKPETQTGGIHATVTDISEIRSGKGSVMLSVKTDAETDQVHLKSGMTGSVLIQVDAVTPAKLVMRASGIFTDMP